MSEPEKNHEAPERSELGPGMGEPGLTTTPEVPEEPQKGRPIGRVVPEAPEGDLEAIAEHGMSWDVGAGIWRREDGKRVCGAHPISPKGPCRQTSLYDNGRCHHHGGPTPRGVASVHYRHGRWSKALNPTRAKQYELAVDDPELLDLRRTLGLLDLTVQEALARREELDTPHFRARAVEYFDAAQKANADGDSEKAGAALVDLGALLRKGVSEDQARDEVARATSRMSKHMEKAWQIRLGAAHAINASDLQAIIGAFIDVIVREVPQENVGPILVGLDREVLRGRLAAAGLDAAIR